LSANQKSFSPNDQTLRQRVQKTAEAAQAKALERKLVIKELVGASGHGYYFSATDSAPMPREYKYLNQGIMRVADLIVTFTILTNDGQEAIVSNAFTMLKSIVRNLDKAAIYGHNSADTRHRKGSPRCALCVCRPVGHTARADTRP
jgi:hypothetical protein